jgi:predicted RNase H-like nuclease (RuvC/YqgF family)
MPAPRRAAWDESSADAPARGSATSLKGRGKHEDELLALREENGALKRHNHEQEDKVRQLGVQMVRIREGLQNQATQNHTTPAHKARAVKELSQADRIAQLELTLAQRDAKEEKLAQQVTYYKQVAFSQAQPSGRGRPTKRLVRPSVAARPASAAAMVAAAGGRPALASILEMTPAGSIGDGGASGAADDRMAALMQMLQEKERQIVALQEREHHGPTASLLPAGASESAQLVELRRNLKDRTAKLTVLQQRYDHLNARFTTVRDNHEKVLAQMSELNRVIRDERTENTRLKQEMHSTAVMQDDLQERGAQLETLQSEKQALTATNLTATLTASPSPPPSPPPPSPPPSPPRPHHRPHRLRSHLHRHHPHHPHHPHARPPPPPPPPPRQRPPPPHPPGARRPPTCRRSRTRTAG